MSDATYPIINVNPIELHSAAGQPQGRTEVNAALSALHKSIKQEGLQYPPLVVQRATGGYTIVDGHRRVRVARDLKWPTIPVLVSTQGDARRLFAAVSGASKPLSATEWVEVYLGGGELPPGPTATSIRRLDKELGREFLVELADKKLSPQVWSLASKVIKYCSPEISEEERNDLLRWIVKHKLGQSLNAAIQMQLPVDKIAKAFHEKRSSL